MDFCASRGVSDAHTLYGSVRSEQRRLGQKDMPPGGLRRIWPVASLLSRSSIAADTLPPSRLATGQIPRNERHRIYELGHLGTVSPFECGGLGRAREGAEVAGVAGDAEKRSAA